MVYKRFRIIVLGRVFLLSATLYLLIHLIFSAETRLYATILIVALATVYQIYGLIHYVEKTNRDLTRFLQTIKHEDFSQTFLGVGLGSSFDELKSAFNDVIQKFYRARADKEEHFRYLQTVVQHVGTGLLAYGQDGRVELYNNAAKKLLRRPGLKNINDLESTNKPLVAALRRLRSGQRDLVKTQVGDESMQLAINATEFRMRDQNFTMVSLQNIQSELEEKEIEAWQNLIRVLTHEIMNSVTPIASLASTINELMQPRKPSNGAMTISREASDDIRGGLQTIQRRSEGLLHFVDAYRNLTRIPTPNLRVFRVIDLLERVRQLMATEIKHDSVRIEMKVVPENLDLKADVDLIEQIIINIIKNAIQALGERSDGVIRVTSGIDPRGRPIIQVADNGPGIPADVRESIFIPFFTTKDSGTGIGLSLSRQIMRLHRGSITVRSEPDVETVFTLSF